MKTWFAFVGEAGSEAVKSAHCSGTGPMLALDHIRQLRMAEL